MLRLRLFLLRVNQLPTESSHTPVTGVASPDTEYTMLGRGAHNHAWVRAYDVAAPC